MKHVKLRIFIKFHIMECQKLQQHLLELETTFDSIERVRSNSTRNITLPRKVNTKTIWKVLKTNLLYPYHIQRVKAFSTQVAKVIDGTKIL